MQQISRRGFLGFLAAPAIIRTTGLLMPVKAPIWMPTLVHDEFDMGTLPPGMYNMTLKEVSRMAFDKGFGLTFEIISGEHKGATLKQTQSIPISHTKVGAEANLINRGLDSQGQPSWTRAMKQSLVAQFSTPGKKV